MATFPFIIAQLVIIVKTNSVHSATGASSSSLKAGADSIIEVHFGCNANEHFIEHLHLAECWTFCFLEVDGSVLKTLSEK